MSETNVNISIEDIWKIYSWGIDHGQLLMEQERESEELFDAAICAQSGEKYCVPSSPVRRRQIHSDLWFAAKNKSMKDFADFLGQKLEDKKIGSNAPVA